MLVLKIRIKEMRKKSLIFGILVQVFLVATIFTLSGLSDSQSKFFMPKTKFVRYSLHFKQYTPMKDTVYVLDSIFIIIDLKTQTAFLNRRNDTTISYKISSGTDKIHKGINTPTGLYTVQNKNPLAISRQFDNAKLLHWIGFKGNIGFHGLAASGYYSYLGKRPSSHGCIRIARKDVEDLYYRIKRGTPVMVIDTNPARVLAFAYPEMFDPCNDIMLRNDNYMHRLIMNKRLSNLLSGIGLENESRVFLDGDTVLKPKGFEIGVADDIPPVQRKVLINIYPTNFDKDNTKSYRNIIFEKT